MLAVVVYVAAAYGWPWLQQRLRSGAESAAVAEGEETENADALSCVARAERALDDFADKLASLDEGQVELDWREAMRRTRVEIGAARRACGCESEACIEASNAMSELGELTQTVEATLLQGGTPHGVAARSDRIRERLVRARALARRTG
jgi:hypothetical protein